jgi:hypothetical protein
MQNKTPEEIRLEILKTAYSLSSDSHYEKVDKAKLLTADNKPYEVDDTRVQDTLRAAKKFSKYVFESEDKQLLTE